MRFSNQIKNQGPLTEKDRRIVASRAILGEWLGGSGGGWQDSGGLWPGIKLITGKIAEKESPEFGISRGCLLPEHTLFSKNEIQKKIEERIVNSIVLVHGGISQDVGPILEIVTEKYLLRREKEFIARKKSIKLFDKIVDALKKGNMKELGKLTTEDWEEAIQKIIPGVNNAFTQNLISKVKEEFKEDYWGFLMLGGMSGGGMAFIVNPKLKKKIKSRIKEIMHQLKDIYQYSFPFIINPVVYDFEINNTGTVIQLLSGKDAKMPKFVDKEEYNEQPNKEINENCTKKKFGFDIKSHEHMKSMLKKREIGLAKNKLPLDTNIQDVNYNEILHFEKKSSNSEYYKLGEDALKRNEVAVITFAGGMGSRWSQGAVVIKPINPFIKIRGKYRTFMEIHLAKQKKVGKHLSNNIAHVFTTSFLTHDAIEKYLKRFNYFDYKSHIYLSQAKSIGHRVFPMEEDLKFFWKDQLKKKKDDETQKVQDDSHNALINWAKSKGEGEDYTENKPIVRFNPPGHWYEIPNLIKNGTLARMIKENPNLKYLFCHNIDTLGAYLEPGLLGMHIKKKKNITFEVTPKRIEDKGGGLAKINNHIQLIEGLALPNEEDEYKLSYYNTLTHWISIDLLLKYFKLDRNTIIEAESKPEKKRKVIEAIRNVEKAMPTYVTIKNVKHLWGSGQEDIYPVAQFEKLWGDMTTLKDLKVNYVSVSRYRGAQLKEHSQLDQWLTDGSYDFVKDKTLF